MDFSARRVAEPIDLAAHPELARGALRLQPPARTVHGPAGAAMVEPRVMQVLLALLAAGGAVLSRDALLAAGWGRSVVGDDALNRAVAGGRRVLREVGAEGWQIETIPRVGYRLVGPGDASAGAGNAVSGRSGGDEPADRSAEGRADEPLAGRWAGAAHGSAEAPGHAIVSVPAGARGDAPGPAHGSAPTAAATAAAGVRPPSQAAAPPGPPGRSRRTLLLGAAGVAAAAVGTLLLTRRDAPGAEARALMSQARDALRLADAPADRRAAELLASAVQQAPRHAPAWGQLALARRAVAEAAPPDALPAALAAVEEAAARALALDAAQPDALLARATLVPAFGQWGRVESALRAILDLDPGHLPTLDALGLLLSSTGVIAAHDPIRRKTIEGDPLHAGYNFRSIYSHWMNGRLGAADAAGERGLELWPRHGPTWLARLSLLAYTGRAERALALLDTAQALQPPPLPPPLLARFRLAWTALASGRAADRRAAVAATLAGLEQASPLMAVSATLDLAALGEADLALDITEAYLLERGPVRAGTAWRPGQPWHVDLRRRFTNHLFLPVAEPLRRHARFAGLMRDIGLVDHWQRSGRAPDHLLRAGT